MYKRQTLYTNFAYIQSKVDLSGVIGATERPMQGQSPYIVNAGLQYLDNEKGYSASISYNVVGKRIFIVGSVDERDYWENSRHIIDLHFFLRPGAAAGRRIPELLATDILRAFWHHENILLAVHARVQSEIE